MNSAKLIINSLDRIKGPSHDFTVLFNPAITDFNFYRMFDATIPESWYTVPIEFNLFRYDFAGVVDTFITPQNYTIAQLVIELNILLPVGVTFTFNAQTEKVTLVNASVTPITLDFTVNKRLGQMLGYEEALFTIPNATNIVAPNVTYIERTLNIFIRCNIAPVSYMNGKNNNPIIYQLPAVQNNVQRRTNNSDQLFNINGQQISSLDFTLLDDYGDLLDLNGQEWQLTIELFK